MASVNIGPIHLSAPFCQAGLAGYSDRAMRLVARRRGCAYAVTEALLDVIMLAGGQGLKKSIDINDEDHPIAGQIIGSEPDTMARAALILHQHKYDVIDLNFACPVKKIKNKARGGHMLRDVERGVAIMRAVRDKLPSSTPISMSLRRAFDGDAESEDQLYALLDEAWRLGFAAARVHGRTVEQKYQGRADWDSLRAIKQAYPKQTIIGSGDVFTAEDAVRMKIETGVDIVWIARGAIGNPWIFGHAAELLAARESATNPVPLTLREGVGGGVSLSRESVNSSSAIYRAHALPPPTLPSLAGGEGLAIQSVLMPPSIAEQRHALEEHFSIAMQIHGEQLAGRRMRKMGIKYARFHPQAVDVKRDFINVTSLTDWRRVMDTWYAGGGPGVWPAQDAVDEVNDDPSMQTCETT